jgi:predicted nucleotidyltransferase
MKLQTWASSRPEIVGLLLVGSYARGAPRSDSDVDIMALTNEPAPFFRDRAWLAHFGQRLGLF